MDVRDTISGIMNLPKTEIGNISEVKKGMTNQSFLFSCDGEEYILRIPGVGTSMLIDRKREAAVYNVLKDSDICDHIIYFNKETGYKISRFYRNACVCNAGNDNDAKRCMIFLRNFHQRKYCVEHSFDLWERINYYESLWTKQTIYEDYNSVKKRVLQLKKYVDMQKKESCLCHIDAVPDNFLLVENEIQLIDWEYAGMQDPHVDIAMFGIYSLYNRSQMDQLIDFYFEEECSKELRIKIYCYIAICGLLWSNWCEYKRMCGVEFGEYAAKQYQYAKEYFDIVKSEIGIKEV